MLQCFVEAEFWRDLCLVGVFSVRRLSVACLPLAQRQARLGFCSVGALLLEHI